MSSPDPRVLYVGSRIATIPPTWPKPIKENASGDRFCSEEREEVKASLDQLGVSSPKC